MVYGKKVIVVMQAYNASKTLIDTFNEVDREIVDSIILVGDASQDNTAEISESVGIITLVHNKNFGYGGIRRLVIGMH
jgi:glycosyltransferase involved in cell wall biosynthesis